MKFSPQTSLFTCLALLANLAAPALVRADPPHSNVICARINTAKAKTDEAERKKNRDRLFSSWKDTLENTITKRHRTEFAAVAQPAINAQNAYFYFLQTKVRDICDIQLGAELGMMSLSQKISELNSVQDKNQMCGRFEQLDSVHKKANEGMSTVNEETSKRLEDLKKSFVESSQTNLSNLDAIPDAGKGLLVPGPVVERTLWQRFFGGGPKPTLKKMPSLREEAAVLWGANAKGMQQANFRADPNSLFGGIMSRLEQDLKTSQAFVKRIEQHNAKVQELRTYCTAIDPNAPAKFPQKDADLDPAPATTPPPSSEDDLVNPYEETPVIPDGPETPEVPETPETPEGPGDDDVNAGAQPPPPKKVKEEGWISKNKGLLLTVGAGAAAVGGLLWYKKSQDKKAQDEMAMLDAEAAARAAMEKSISSPSSSSGETSTNLGGAPANTVTPHGSKFIVSGIPAGAEVNSDLSAITVSIIDPQGIQTYDSSTEVTVGCSVPAGCSLAGTLTVNSSGGKAVFSDLRFTAPHEGVKLIFSAPGFESVASTNPFNVTGTANESPRE